MKGEVVEELEGFSSSLGTGAVWFNIARRVIQNLGGKEQREATRVLDFQLMKTRVEIDHGVGNLR